MSGNGRGKPFVEAIKTLRPGRKARRLAVWAVFLALTACLAAMSVAVAMRF